MSRQEQDIKLLTSILYPDTTICSSFQVSKFVIDSSKIKTSTHWGFEGDIIFSGAYEGAG
jgi:hypothetical protein